MATKEANAKKNEVKQLFNEIHQIASAGASPIMREALDKYKARFIELTESAKKAKA